MKKLFLLPLATALLFGYEDLGVIGKTYPIKEKSIKEQIIEGVKKLDKEKMKRDYIASIESAFTAKVSLPASKTDSKKEYRDEVIVEFDIKDPNDSSRVLFYKGELMPSNLPDGQILHMCFVDAKNEALAKVVIKEFGECDYLIANRDIRRMDYMRGNRVFPMGEPYINRFKVSKLPVKLTMYKDKILKTYLSVPRLIEEIKEREE